MKPPSIFLLAVSFTFLCNCEPTSSPSMENQDQPAVTVAWKGKNILGEGSFWNHKTGELWWVDIEGMELHTLRIIDKRHRVYSVGARIGTVVPDVAGNAVVALQNGIYTLDLESEAMTLLAHPLDSFSNIRYNDGKVCPAGRFWVGSMHLKQIEGEASLYKVEPDGATKQILSNMTISNGIVWTKDHKKMYYIDTPTGQVREFDYDKSTGAISNERNAVTVPEEVGFPDGMAIDADDKLWIALWNGNAVSQWDPNTGELLQKIEVPAHNVTSCTFGGPNLDTLFITTAREDMTPEEEKEFPLSGSVFATVPGVSGVELPFFGEDL